MRMIGPILCASLLLSGCGDETQDSIEVRDAIAADWASYAAQSESGGLLYMSVYCNPPPA